MRKRALWIFDEAFCMLTYLSVRSFLESCDAIITLVYCGEEMKPEDEAMFLKLETNVEIHSYNTSLDKYEPRFHAHIRNRLARMHFARLYEDDLLFMIDSDVAFAHSIEDDFKEIEEHFESKDSNGPIIAGVVEFLSARDAYLYFKKKTSSGFTRKVPELNQVAGYQHVYGEDWPLLTDGFQYNNGFLIFYQARELIDQWEEYYLTGLDCADINPLDDQVPLSAAIQKTDCDYWLMDRKWNSLGDLNGSFNMFHAWGGEWKIEIDHVLRNKTAVSGFGEICVDILDDCAEHWINDFRESLTSIPYRYRHIHGAFDHGTVFTDLLSELDEGYIVEVGTYKGRSACFVAELIRNSEKAIKFDTIDHFLRDDTSKSMVINNLHRAGVGEFVDVIEADSLSASQNYHSEQLDFIFLDTDSPAEALERELEAWYAKLKAGGVIAGYDHTIHDTVFKSYDCVVTSFCEKYEIPVSTYEYQFVIRKPQKKECK